MVALTQLLRARLSWLLLIWLLVLDFALSPIPVAADSLAPAQSVTPTVVPSHDVHADYGRLGRARIGHGSNSPVAPGSPPRVALARPHLDARLKQAKTQANATSSTGIPSQRLAAAAPDLANQQVSTTFPGISYELQVQTLGADQQVWPPDTQIAVGPTTIVELVNSSGTIWSKSGAYLGSYDLNTFFGVPNTFSFSDPRILYDSLTGHWFSSGMAFDYSNDGIVYAAVSATSDPTGLWYVYPLEDNLIAVLYDQPKLGVSGDKVVVSWDDYTLFSYLGQETIVLDKLLLIAGDDNIPYYHVGPDPSRFSIVPSVELTPSNTEYLVYNNADPYFSQNSGQPTIGVIEITGLPSTRNIGWNEVDLPVAGTTVPPDAFQPGGGPLVASDDDRFLSAIWQNGVLWTGGNDGCMPAGDFLRRSCLRLVQLNTGGASPTVLQSFDVGTSGQYLFYPAPTLDGAGNAYFSFGVSSLSIFPSAATSTQPLGTPLDTTTVPLIYQAGSGMVDVCGVSCGSLGGNQNSWGDYSGVAPDPSDPTSVWVAAEYAASSSDTFDWGTSIAEVTLVSPPTPSPTVPPTATASPTWTSTSTPTPTATATGSSSAVASPTASSSTPTVAIVPTNTPMASTESPTGTSIPTDTATLTSSAIPLDTPTPVTIQIVPGSATNVSATVGSAMVDIAVPSGEAISQITVATPGPNDTLEPADASYQALPGVAVVASATGPTGAAVTQLNAPVTISFTFKPPLGVNPLLAQIYTSDSDGTTTALSTQLTAVDHGTFVASAATTHLSSIAVFAPGVTTQVPRIYLPLANDAAPSAGW